MSQSPISRSNTFNEERWPISEDPKTPNPRSTSRPDSTVKRLIVLCDGTWKSSDSGEPEIATNITRLSRALDCVDQRDDKHDVQQIVYYQSGLGSGELLKTQWLAAGALGFGLDNNVQECYSYLASNYQHGSDIGQEHTPDDEIFLFGFSRGAYTVRALAGFISEVGLLTKRGMDDFIVIYSEFKKGKDSFEEFKRRRTEASHQKIPWEAQREVKIKVVAIMDCVGSVGLPEGPLTKILNWNQGFGFYDTELVPGIENAFHALALDEKRKPFSPTLFHASDYKPGDNPQLSLSHTNSWPSTVLPKQKVNLVQTWFCGVHSNIGGGYPDHKQSDIILAWLVDHTQHLLKFDQSYLRAVVENTERKAFAVQADPSDQESKPWYYRFWPPTVDASIAAKGYPGWAMGTIYNSFNGFFNLTGSKPRTPGQYFPTELTNEYIHSSVRVRYNKDEAYRQQCQALYGARSTKDQKTGKYIWEIAGGKAHLEEEEIGVVRAFDNDGLPGYSMEAALAGPLIMAELKK